MQPPSIVGAVAIAESWLNQRIAAVGSNIGNVVAGIADAPRMACERCHTDWPTHTMACPSCGGPLAPLVPLAVQCGFCGSANRRDLVDRCTSCAGPLPILPGGSPGEQPPPPPRSLPTITSEAAEAVSGNARVSGYILIGVGVPFTIFGLGFVLVLIGLWMLFAPKIRHVAKVSALTRGHATRARLRGVTAKKWSHAHDNGTTEYTKYRIRYEFEERGKKRAGTCIGYDPSHALRRDGDEAWVVYVPGQAWWRSALWPPIR